jgi:septal ring factor EnvC (AmiA/AmiB activator)
MAAEESEIQKRIQELESALASAEGETRSLEGKIRNRAQAADSKPIQDEITRMETRLKRLRSLLGACLLESVRGANEPEAFHQSESLRLSAVEYFKRTNVDTELWKNIAS